MRHYRDRVECTDRTDARSPLLLAKSVVTGAIDAGNVDVSSSVDTRSLAVLTPPFSMSVLCARDRTLALSLDSASDSGSGMSGGAWDANDGGRSEYPLRCDVASESARARPAPSVAYTPRELEPFVWRGTGDALGATGE